MLAPVIRARTARSRIGSSYLQDRGDVVDNGLLYDKSCGGLQTP